MRGVLTKPISSLSAKDLATISPKRSIKHISIAVNRKPTLMAGILLGLITLELMTSINNIINSGLENAIEKTAKPASAINTDIRGSFVANKPERNPKKRVTTASIGTATDHSITPVCGIPHGSVTNPPLYCPQRNILVAFDSSNSVVRAWRHDPQTEELTELWTRENFGMGGHTIYYRDTGEIVTADYQSLKTLRGLREGENSVVLDIETGKEKARVASSLEASCRELTGKKE